jgi:hypothetical protein
MKLTWRARRILDNVWGPSATILFHIVLLVFIVKFFTMRSRQVEREVEVVVKEIETFDQLDDIEQELDELQDIPTVVDAVAPPTVAMDQEPPPVDVLSPGEATDVADVQMDVMEAVSPLQFKGLYASRSATGRQQALQEYSGGMGERTEFAVRKALEWLKLHQYADGSWGPYHRVAMTGLALLSFFAHGETTSSADYGPAIRKGLKFLLASQKEGIFVGGGPWYHGPQVMAYEHAIGTYAISEAYALTGIPFLKPAMEDAVQRIVDGQHEAGSWDYGYKVGPEAQTDTSLSGWHIQALKSAVFAGAENRGLKTALENAMRGLKSQWAAEKNGLFKYGTRAPHEPDLIMTGVAVLCMQLAGHALDAEARAGLNTLKDLECRWARGAQNERGVGVWPLYAWYYITQARFQQGGKTWVAWNKSFAPVLCAEQNADGSWCPAPDSQEAMPGPVYCTALSTLMLEVYYRFLPTYKPIEVEKAQPVEEKSGEEIVIKFGEAG